MVALEGTRPGDFLFVSPHLATDISTSKRCFPKVVLPEQRSWQSSC